MPALLDGKTTASDFYQVVGLNNRNLLVQSKRVAPYHEDNTKVQIFEPSSVSPGQYTKIKLDLKHASDREIILNDIRLQFNVDFSLRVPPAGNTTKVGQVLCVRGTDLIREMTVKINEDIVFHVDKRFELSMLWEMNNHKTLGSPVNSSSAILLNHGIIPQGRGLIHRYNTTDNTWYTGAGTGELGAVANRQALTAFMTSDGEERHDGLPRVIYDDDTGGATYMFTFDMSLNALVGPIFHRLHLRRIEYVQIELLFEPFLSSADTQSLLLFKSPPTGADGTLVHPYSVARFTNLQIQQYRTTLLDGIQGFTVPDTRMLSWLMHRYSRREFTFNFDTQTSIDIQLHDWEIRTNIVRIWWMIAPTAGSTTENEFHPFGEPTEGFDYLSGVEILWKNDKVLDLATTYDVQRHYILSDNKRYGFDDPFVRFARLDPHPLLNPTTPWSTDLALQKFDNQIRYYRFVTNAATPAQFSPGEFKFEFPIYHVDLDMNIQQGVPGAELIAGIVNDTSDYVIRLKRLSDRSSFLHTGTRTLWVWLEYQTLVNLAGGSNQFSRGSQVITKQLNPQ